MHTPGYRTLLRIVRSNSRSTLKNMTAKFNNRAIFSYSIRRRLFDSGFKRPSVSKKITIGPFNRERRPRFCSLKINWFVENDSAKTIFLIGQSQTRTTYGGHISCAIGTK